MILAVPGDTRDGSPKNEKRSSDVNNRRRAFSPDFKREVVRQALQPGNTIARFSRDIGLHQSVLRRWIQEVSMGAEVPVSEIPPNDEQSQNLSRLRNQVISRRIARETVAAALGEFGTSSQVDEVEAALVVPSESDDRR